MPVVQRERSVLPLLPWLAAQVLSLVRERMPSLKRLWDEWNAQWLRWEQASDVYEEAYKKVREACGLRWKLDGYIAIGYTPAEAPCSARFTAYENGELKSENRGLRPDPPRGP